MKRRLQDDQVKVQVSIHAQLRDEITKYANSQGFTSLQEFTRIMYKSVLTEELQFYVVAKSQKPALPRVTEQDVETYRRDKLKKANHTFIREHRDELEYY